jgi:hypothetical protein
MITKNDAPVIRQKRSSELQAFFQATMVKTPSARGTTAELLALPFCHAACSDTQMTLFFESFHAIKLKNEANQT